MQLRRRSESIDRSTLVETFVNVGPLFNMLSSHDHQIIFGRRGTGKTHALFYLAEHVSSEGDIPIYIDLRNVGSSGGLYSDHDIPLPERATRLLVDTLGAIHEALSDFFGRHAEEYDLSASGPLLDNLAKSITQVRVAGNVEREITNAEESENKNEIKYGLKISPRTFEASLGDTTRQQVKQTANSKLKEIGQPRYYVHFGSVRRAIEQLTRLIQPHRIWVLLDEWSSIPIELQPYLADLLRRSIFTLRDATVKIASIEYRSDFYLTGNKGDYIGIELGADASAGINLDDYMVFDNNAERARAFYKELFYKHISATDVLQKSEIALQNSDQLIRFGFTQINTFDELVRASEGVPRDAINIVISAAQSAYPGTISMDHIRKAARSWYQTDKEAAIRSNEQAADLLHWIINEVIGQRKARAFLLASTVQHPLIEGLFDSRLLHILKRNISSRDEPGVRYDVYKLDYGCYVDLMTTTRAPQGLLLLSETDGGIEIYVDVPPDDYRSIRRAILNLSEFGRASAQNLAPPRGSSDSQPLPLAPNS
jgi:hypothetical protein